MIRHLNHLNNIYIYCTIKASSGEYKHVSRVTSVIYNVSPPTIIYLD